MAYMEQLQSGWVPWWRQRKRGGAVLMKCSGP